MSKYENIQVGYQCQDSKGNKGVVTEILGFKCAITFEDGFVREGVPKNKVASSQFLKDLPEKLAKINVPLGTQYGNLTVIGFDGARLVVSCSCGKTVKTYRTSVMKLGKISCGCLAREGTENYFWEDFNRNMEKWNPDTHMLGVKKIPLFKYKRGSTKILSIAGFSYVDSDFYEVWKGFPFIKTKSGYAWLSSSKYVKKVLCKSKEYLNNFPKYALHHLVKGFRSTGNYVIDHINGMPLDNRCNNLRVATRTENGRNARKKNGHDSSIYKGVCKDRGKWRATVNVGCKSYTKKYDSEIEAAMAYNNMAIEHYGDFAKLNKI